MGNAKSIEKNSDVIFGAESKAHAQELWDAIDKDKNGSLDKAEMTALILQLMKQVKFTVPPKEEIDRFVDKVFRVLGNDKAAMSRAAFDENIGLLGYMLQNEFAKSMPAGRKINPFFTGKVTEVKRRALLEGRYLEGQTALDQLAWITAAHLADEGRLQSDDAHKVMAVSFAIAYAAKKKWPAWEFQFSEVYNDEWYEWAIGAGKEQYGRHFNY